MQVVRRPHSGVLTPLIAELGYYSGDMGHRYEQILPSGSQDLMVNLHADRFWAYDPGRSGDHRRPAGTVIRGAALGGAHCTPTVADTGDQRTILNVHFRTGGAYPFFGAAAAATTGRLVELDALWGTAGRTLRERLLEASGCPGPPRVALVLDAMEEVLLERLRHGSRPDPAAAFAACALERGVSVAGVTDALGWTSKRLVRHFTTHVGLSPKRFARVRRLQRVLRAVEGTCARPGGAGPDWARVAHEHGFYDQAHFVNDFKALTGITPTAYHPRSPDEHNHIPLAT